jgi:hypothetical protein
MPLAIGEPAEQALIIPAHFAEPHHGHGVKGGGERPPA